MTDIERISYSGIVENIANGLNLTIKEKLHDLKQDLIQEVYLILLEYDKDKIHDMVKNNTIRFFVWKIVQNQFNSAYSPFYKKYKKYIVNKSDLNDIINKEEDDKN